MVFTDPMTLFHGSVTAVIAEENKTYPLRYPSENNPDPQAIVGQLRSQRVLGVRSRGAVWIDFLRS
jgi:hypothetical protein